MTDGVVMKLDEISARDFSKAEEYWNHILVTIKEANVDAVVMEGFRLYRSKTETQINSQFETPQLIGTIRHFCYMVDIPLHIQYATEVMGRWKDDILVNTGHLSKRGKQLLWNGEATNDHKRDALRHALHFWRYNRGLVN